ncbi:MAG: sensor histidine kinase [Gemmatimonadota bacterium]
MPGPEPQGTADPRLTILALERDRAERVLNRVRVAVLVLLGLAAATYAPSLTEELNKVNIQVLVPALAWTLIQYPLFTPGRRLPQWIRVANPIVDITAVSVLLWGYSVAESPGVAFKTPIFAAYFLILAALPLASSTRKAAVVAALAVAEYAILLVAALASGRLRLILDPIEASGEIAVSPLDEGAKLLLLACAGAVATYATKWQERLTSRYAEVSSQSEALRTRLTRTQLQALKLQLQPHFLFNTLNAITALVHRDAERAERMISGLSELLRVSLGGAGDEEVTLARELEVLRHYVDIQQVRFEDRLTIAIHAPADLQRALVPNFMLQPLVENAIRHGLGPRAVAVHIAVSAARKNGTLHLVVRDDGVGEVDAASRREGIGLGNTRARLESLYGARQRFEAGSSPGEPGFEVRVALPYHEDVGHDPSIGSEE